MKHQQVFKKAQENTFSMLILISPLDLLKTKKRGPSSPMINSKMMKDYIKNYFFLYILILFTVKGGNVFIVLYMTWDAFLIMFNKAGIGRLFFWLCGCG